MKGVVSMSQHEIIQQILKAVIRKCARSNDVTTIDSLLELVGKLKSVRETLIRRDYPEIDPNIGWRRSTR